MNGWGWGARAASGSSKGQLEGVLDSTWLWHPNLSTSWYHSSLRASEIESSDRGSITRLQCSDRAVGTLVGHLLLRVWGSNRPRLLLVGRHGATHHLLLLRMRWLLIRMWGKSTVLQRSLIRSMHCLRGLLFRLRGWSGLSEGDWAGSAMMEHYTTRCR